MNMKEIMKEKYPTTSTPFIRPMKDLLLDQQKGRFLTPYEKKEIQRYAESQRKKKMAK